MNEKELRDFEQLCETQYEYETSHDDAADAYSIIWEEKGIDTLNVKRFYFDMYSNVDDEDEFTVCLGNGEVEIQLPRELTKDEAEWFSRNTDYVVNPSALDLAYQCYPMNLIVRAEYYEEG